MTIRFRAAEADELVDDERAAQRIYMGSAMTMEPGEFYCFLELSPIPNPIQQPAACLPPPLDDVRLMSFDGTELRSVTT